MALANKTVGYEINVIIDLLQPSSTFALVKETILSHRFRSLLLPFLPCIDAGALEVRNMRHAFLEHLIDSLDIALL